MLRLRLLQENIFLPAHHLQQRCLTPPYVYKLCIKVERWKARHATSFLNIYRQKSVNLWAHISRIWRMPTTTPYWTHTLISNNKIQNEKLPYVQTLMFADILSGRLFLSLLLTFSPSYIIRYRVAKKKALQFTLIYFGTFQLGNQSLKIEFFILKTETEKYFLWHFSLTLSSSSLISLYRCGFSLLVFLISQPRYLQLVFSVIKCFQKKKNNNGMK